MKSRLQRITKALGWAIALVILAAMAAATAGCCNVMMRTQASGNLGPYYSTREVAYAVSLPFRDPIGPEGELSKVICTFFLPFFVVDLPFEAVTDTAMFPWDYWQTSRAQAERDAQQEQERTEVVL